MELSFTGVIGWIFGLIGIVVAIKSKRTTKLVYKRQAFRIIEVGKLMTTEDMKILFKDKRVSRLTRTYIVLWNSGSKTIRGENIVEDDPFRLEFGDGAEVLRAIVISKTKKANKFLVETESKFPNKVICKFDYLDAKDGVLIEILHTDKKLYPKVLGSIRGLPKGIKDLGTIPAVVQDEKLRKNWIVTSSFGVLISVLVILGVLFVPVITTTKTSGFTPSKYFFVCGGLIFAFLSILTLWHGRRQFPKSLIPK